MEHDKLIYLERCGRCRRRLRDPKSQERGFGPCCYKKYKEARAKEEFEKNQQHLELTS